MSADEILDSYKLMVDFLGKVYGKNCEVILHDLRKIDRSIIAIANNHITGRTVGDSITDFALRIIHDKEYENKDYLTNYLGKVPSQEKYLRASTWFIRDKEGNLIGMLCFNVDITAFQIMKRMACDLLMENEGEIVANLQNEEFTGSMDELLQGFIKAEIGKYNSESSRLLMEEKREIVKSLDARGFFLLKGAVCEVAKRLDTSEPTIYRYIKD